MPSPSRLRLVTTTSAGWPGWAEVAEEFVQHLESRQLSEHTVVWYRSILSPFQRFLNAAGKHDPPSCVDVSLARAFIAEVSSRGPAGRGPIAAKRQNDYRDGLHLFWRWLIEEGYTTNSPWESIPKAREGHKIIPTLTPTQIKALLDQPQTDLFVGLRDYCFIMLLLDTGLRLSEALNLRLPDLDIEYATVKVLGKGNKERVAGLSTRMIAQLEQYL